ncbi:ATP-binding protein [Amycolatopsis sp. NPDC051071]|uniref:ATP-binding protein n=1 Tax=Amycolatopsis sp. NPDC051071 TaxID=3154637 RepID=UPI003436FDA1
MSARTSQVDDLRLVAQPNAVLCSELFVRLILSDWSLRPLLDQAKTAAAKLVGALVDAADPKTPPFLTLRLRLKADVLVIEVDHDLDRLAAPTPAAGERTGVVPCETGGVTTWCELPLPGGLSAGQVQLPRRGDRRTLVDEPVSGAPVGADPEVLERLLSRLSGWSG